MATATQPALIYEAPARSKAYFGAVLFLGAYAVLLVIGVIHHEPWADEAQAWQMARVIPLGHLVFHQLRYENHPALWYLVLASAQHLGLRYDNIGWIVATFNFAGVAILISRAPFRPIVRYALALTFFLSFQYAIVARGYALAPLLLFALAATWRNKNALWTALLLGVMANLELHFFVIGIGFAVIYVMELREGQRVRYLYAAAVVILALYLFAALTMFPRPVDGSFVPPALHPRSFFELAGSWLLASVVYILCALGKPWQVGLPMLIALAYALWRFKPVRYLLPLALVVLFSGKFFNFWHLGILELTAIACAWIAWPIHLRSRRAEVVGLGLLACYLALHISWSAYAYWYDFGHLYSSDRIAAKFLRPIVETGTPMAVTYVKSADINPKDPSLIEPVGAFHSVGLAPYFNAPLFLNEPLTFWDWNRKLHQDSALESALAERPPIVVAMYYDHQYHPFDAGRDLQRPRILNLTSRGYRFREAFCGAKPEDFREREHICYLIFQLP